MNRKLITIEENQHVRTNQHVYQIMENYTTRKDEKYYNRTFRYFQNGLTITCVITSEFYKGVGIAKCNPNDQFNYSKGMYIAEYRTQQDFYRDIEQAYIKKHCE